MKTFDKLAINSVDEFIYGRCPHPVTTRSGLVIGGGTVYPELNFTLPPMTIEKDTMDEVRKQYDMMIRGACARAAELSAPGLVVEFELLPPMTIEPEWGAEITAILRQVTDEYAKSHGLKSALRITPNDIREHERPPYLRRGHLWDDMLRSFELNCKAGADFISIESTGGKEVNDDAMIFGDLHKVCFALGTLAYRDMSFLWKHIVDICGKNKVIPAGDTACGFGNTAMVLADQKYIPKLWAAIVRVMTVPRTLACYEQGAVGPSKDCAYEGPYMKAITGYPISMEGRDAACAHLSPVGNISQALADLWSNESVQNIKLLGGMAPTVSVEQLIFTTRLMNTATRKGGNSARDLRDLLVESDQSFDPQAHVLKPDVVLKLSRDIVAQPTGYLRTRQAAISTINELRAAQSRGDFVTNANEQKWLDKLTKQADTLPEDEDELISMVIDSIEHDKVRLEEYDVDVKKYGVTV